MRILILATSIFTISMLVSAGNISKKQEVLNRMNAMMFKFHSMEATKGSECFYKGDDIVCIIEKDENVSINEYNKSVNWLLSYRAQIEKEWKGIGLKGKVIYKEL